MSLQSESHDNTPAQELRAMSHQAAPDQRPLDQRRSLLIQDIKRKDLPSVKKTLKLSNVTKRLFLASYMYWMFWIIQYVSLLDKRGHKTYRLILDSDNFGVTALEYAVRDGSTEMVDEFICRCDTTKEKAEVLKHALMVAIKEDNFELVEHLLGHKANLESPTITDEKTVAHSGVKIRTHKPSDEESDEPGSRLEVSNSSRVALPRRISEGKVFEYEDAEYADDMTPLVLAAHLERHNIIKLLLEKDSPDIHPLTAACHNIGNKCILCRETEKFMGSRSLEESRQFITLYRALSSPAYIFQSETDDPILEAFLISDRLDNLREEDHAFRDEYEALSLKCREFATELVSLCRDSEEVETLLNHAAGVDHINPYGYTKEFPRLLVALNYNQKEFVAHPNCQQILQKRWHEDLPGWVRNTHNHHLRLTAYAALKTVLFPVIALLYMIRIPWVSPYMKSPIDKFINHTLCYLLFLFLLMLNAMTHQPMSYGEIPSPLVFTVYVWILGMTIITIRAYFRHRGFSLTCYHLSNISWKLYDMALLLCFWGAFILRTVGIGIAYHQNKVGQERHEWCNMWDPHLLSEGCWAVGVMLAVLKINDLFKASSHLGPLQISLKKMIYDVVRFIFIFLTVLSAFAFSMTSLYKPYKGSVRYDPHKEQEKEQPNTFISWRTSYKTLFWNLFGYGDPTDADIVVDNVPEVFYYSEINNTWLHGSNSPTCGPKVTKHKITEAIGYLLFMAYHLVVIIVLLNMLIAMMASSYDDIEKNADKEWKFARTRLRMSYFNEVGCLPPPFNILPIRALIGRMIHWRKLCRRSYSHDDHCSCYKCREMKQDKLSTIKLRKHKKLMERLSKRYWNRRKHQQQRPEELREVPRVSTTLSLPSTPTITPTLLIPGSSSSVI